ncbi:MAG: hypothetical protein ACFFE4_16810 [Candidatus Thorarchaeota archaeon]
MDNWKEIIGALLGVLIAVVWLAFAMIGFHVFYAIALTMVFGTLSGGMYALSAKQKENNKSK